jgi:hypothetical protein
MKTYHIAILKELLAFCKQTAMQFPERARLLRGFKSNQTWTIKFPTTPTLLGGVDSFCIELIPPSWEDHNHFSLK